MKTQALFPADFAEALDCPISSVPLLTGNLGYRELTSVEVESCILDVLRALDADLPSSGPREVARWEEGWRENLEEYIETGSFESLLPKYFVKHNILRHRRRYIRPMNPLFEADYYATVCHILFRKYLSEASSVIEFGCGSGAALLILANMFPHKPLVGCDWAKTSQDIVEAIAQRTGSNIRGVNFDMFCPLKTVPFTEGCAAITVLAMEQLGADYESFLEFLLARRPAICLHLEPIVELYDENNLLDYLAIRYHHKRGYLRGFLPHLQRLEAKGEVELVDVRRLFFGSQFHEAYSCVIWRPL